MANITLKDVPAELHATLENEAEANYRSLDQEIVSRLQRSLDSERATRRDQQWVDEALASGPEEPFSQEKFDAAVQRGLQRAKEKAA
jgi:hypothetical protein